MLRFTPPGAFDAGQPKFGLLRSLRNLARLAKIGLILARHDALFLFAEVPVVAFYVRLAGLFARRRGRVAARPGERLAAALDELGPGFIKLGQLLSTRADLFGEEIAADLARLQDRLPAVPGAAARAAIEREFGQPLEALFQSFDETAIAAASIAQVHFARSNDGQEVAVKVLRPGVAEAFARDLDLFDWLAVLIERVYPPARRLKPVEIVRTLAEIVTFEMDLRFEAAAASELAENFAGDLSFHVPRIDWSRTGRGVLTLERIEGVRIDDRAGLIAAGHRIEAVLAKAAGAFFNQVFRDGFFHADMHPGNMFVDASGAIVVIDFGIMGRLDRDTRWYLADMLVGFLVGDYRRVAEVHFAAGYVPSTRSIDAFTQACRAIGEPILGRPLQEISVARLLAQLFQVTEQFDMETQPQLLLLQKTMVLVEGVGRRLDPNINIWAMAQPLIESWMRDNRGPEAQLRRRLETVAETVERLPRLVQKVEDFVENVSREGVLLHAESLASHAAEQAKRAWLAVLPLYIAAAALVAIAAALIFSR
ncbi:MAG TPA: 2-polyprenylphenol 6-hydroxylase [Stellaceae bacterium]|nr:2-polyprenylphenol 6-hydroxylase [Stellaceae bacterium]HUC11933.1 2-polyprenylphenol 6-hydroxylase [Stellaceae bacterium]